MTLNHRIARGFVRALAVSAFAAAPGLAQSADPFAPRGDAFDKAMEGAPAPSGIPTSDLALPPMGEAGKKAGQLDELAKEIGATPVPATGASGSASSPAASPFGSPEGAGPAGPAGPAGAGQTVDHSVEIDGNYDATVAIYQNILDKQGYDPANLDRRIQANEEMIARYKPALVCAETELRKMQVDFMNRAFQLKQQKEHGQITDDMFGKLIAQEELKHNRKREGLAQDVEFYKDEIVQAETRLKELREQRRLVAERAKREGREPPKKKAPGEALFQGFSATLDQLSGFNTRFTMDGGAACRSCNHFHRPEAAHGPQGTPPPSAGAK